MTDARAVLDLPIATAADAFRQAAEFAGMRVSDTNSGVTIHFLRGQVVIGAANDKTSLEVQAKDAAASRAIRETLDARIASLGLSMEWEVARAAARPANMSLARVTSVEAQRTPSYTRVVMDGPELARLAEGGLHFRLLMGPDGADFPTLGEDGALNWPGGADAWQRPVFTARDIEKRPDGSARVAFDVFLHQSSRVAAWVRALEPDTEVAILGPTGGRRPPNTGWIALVGDETALPAVARILEGCDRETFGTATIFVRDADDIQTLKGPDGIEVRWCLRGSDETPLDALYTLDIPSDDRFVFFAGERRDAVAARGWLNAQGLSRDEFSAATFWTAAGP